MYELELSLTQFSPEDSQAQAAKKSGEDQALDKVDCQTYPQAAWVDIVYLFVHDLAINKRNGVKNVHY